MRHLAACEARFPIDGKFVISRGAKTEAVVIRVSITQGAFVGQGEAVPYARYNETVSDSLASIDAIRDEIEKADDPFLVCARLPAGAARNALDCALWDLRAKLTGQSVSDRLGLCPLKALTTAYTLSLDSPENMAQKAALHAHRPLLKLKIGGLGDLEAITRVHEAAPHAKLIIDGNEGLSFEALKQMAPFLCDLNVVALEQPLPAKDDALLADYDCPVPLYADESAHTSQDLARLALLYDGVNLKLDKTGGLSEGVIMAREARAHGLKIMVGCMVASSLAMAPAFMLAQDADLVDLDGPLLLAHDCEHGLKWEGSLLYPPTPSLWG